MRNLNSDKAAKLLRPSLRYRFVFGGESRALAAWTAGIALLVLFEGFYIPFVLCFPLVLEPWTISLEYAVCTVYVIDILLHFNRAYTAKGYLLTERRLIAKHYLQTWFTLDVLATFPFDAVLTCFQFDDLAPYFKVTRLLRFAKMRSLWLSLEEHLTNSSVLAALTCMKLSVFVLLTAHLSACFWVFASADSLHPDAWIVYALQSDSCSLTNLYIDQVCDIEVSIFMDFRIEAMYTKWQIRSL